MGEMRADYRVLQDSLTGEFFRVAGFKPDGLIRKVFGTIIHKPTSRFSQLAIEFENEIEQRGLSKTSSIFLERYANGSLSTGEEKIPGAGPLIIASNHPGTFDLFTIVSRVPRDDIKFIISGVPFVRNLPAVSRYLIYTTSDPYGRMNVVREAIKHVNSGGCLILYPTGILDPDPEVMDGAYPALFKWSRSIELILRRNPNAQIQVAIVSGVIPPTGLRHPITRLATEPWKKQRLAEFILVAKQLMSETRFDVNPKVSFSSPMRLKEIVNGQHKTITDGLINKAYEQMNYHLQIYPSLNQSGGGNYMVSGLEE